MTTKTKGESTPTDTEAASTEAAFSISLTYGESVEVEGGVRVQATDGQGNYLTVDAETREKAQAVLRAAFKSLTGGS